MSAKPETSNTNGFNNEISSIIEGYSLEMTGKDVPGLLEAKRSIPAGTRINVTFLGNENLEMRLTAASAVRDLGFVPVPHISARRLSSQYQFEEYLDALQQAGASENVFIIGGDPVKPEGPYSDSCGLIRSGLLTKYGVKHVGVAGYPEGHPDINHEKLWDSLAEKTTLLNDQGLKSSIVTQFAFDTDPVIDWIDNLRAMGISSEIRVGTPGPAGVRRLLGFARRFGIGANAMIAKKYGFSLTNLMGTAGPDKFVTELSERLATSTTAGPVKLHFYTFGGLQATSDWAQRYKAQRQD